MVELAPRWLKGRSYAETRSAVLDLIRSGESVSRVELARRSGLTEATISKIVKDLLADGVVMKAGMADSTGGKRPTLLALNSGVLYALGVTRDVSEIVIVLCALNGVAVDQRHVPIQGSESPPDLMARTAAAIMELLDAREIARHSIVGVGLASGGRRSGPLGWGKHAAVADSWERYDVGEGLRQLLDLPVVVENDANCAALGAFWSSGKDAPRTFMTVYMSYGIGAGIVIGGALYRGSSGNAGEIGHIVVAPGGEPCWCGSTGCLETVAAPRGIVRRVLSDPVLGDAFGVGPDREVELVYRQVIERFEGDQPEALELVEDSARLVAIAVLGLANTLDLDWIQLAGSGFATAGEVYLSEIRSALSRASLARGVHPVTVELGKSGPEVAALGAASVVLHGSLTPHHDLEARL